MSIVEIHRDNLNIGIYLTQYDAHSKEDILGYMGYTPGARGRIGNYDHYHNKFRKAIDMGAQRYTERDPDWFFISAIPYGNNFLYRTVWYVAPNGTCIPLFFDQFVTRVIDRRRKDTNTRIERTRGLIAAEALRRIRIAMRNGDAEEYKAIISELVSDEVYGSIMEIVTGHYGVEYAEMIPLIELLLQYPETTLQRFGLSRALKDIRKAKRIREQGINALATTLTNIVMLRAGHTHTRAEALNYARQRLMCLPPP
jgi:hypothetical protein